ncbi:type I restriction endonuclease subunit R [Myroides odoratimimus]|uniref:type I restriction endonuclease subunit R n=1 Tax=Myroides odoratimimus TaxID=76832 RepID=UPI001CE16CC0|nr:HsdR family type I site-specific deoxyribonuclease [Myroides odoratimimus]MCA4792686.1 type I restriction endonuclease subunit R [Myroides odoratimimus]MCA4819872.1 type I restriction endonuclease subunit R [Myroides odoratimimus]MDM1401243.1 type I restriction endonuclease subunit R [Myroides odoratimimus]MDM1457207.1 type I restriction endonuclease subunit R [Myroides odoratimimus]MEC4085774.1 HsdR family type I site-specific deoxyribonuclease [Myroides odoratimimus]
MSKINYSEYSDSQVPAIEVLRKLGWEYLSPEEALAHRNGLYSNVILENVLVDQLAKINSFEYKGKQYPFSNSTIQSAVNNIKNVPDIGLVQTNKAIQDELTLGKSYNETIAGDRKAYTLRYIDWQCIENNVFHVTEEFTVEGSREKKRPDLVLFVNGIPFVVIENKRRDKNNSIAEAISQHLRNQKATEGIPRLFHYAKLLLAVQPNEVKYAGVGTPEKFWAVWKEDNEKEVQKLLSSKAYATAVTDRLPTVQDRNIVSLCDRSRLMDMVYKYLIYDGPATIIVPRYQQYFAVISTVERVKQWEVKDEKRKGGVVWHTTGSGKSLTMVMISKVLALDPAIDFPRVVVVTDRKDLDRQIFDTFKHCEKNVVKANSGAHLIELLKDKGVEVITTIIDKFEIASKAGGYKDEGANIFVLVDESHRSQYGPAHAMMKRVLPNASYIGFTGTPLMKNEKSTAKKFGGFIHKYTIDQAVKDGAVLPLLYEGRQTLLSVNTNQLDKGFERLASNLSEEAQKDLKKKFSSISKIYEGTQVIEEIAYDISKHYTKNWQGGIYKAQLAVPRIETAIKYQKYFESQTDPALKINTAVIFTPPDSRQNHTDAWKDTDDETKRYWDLLVEKYGSQEAYEEDIVGRFKEEGQEVELLIVVSKLLTGFDAPRNTVLYLAKPLHSHNLLQAIARVNRLFSGKEHGYIIDYVGVLGKLDEALTSYSAFDEFDEEDIVNAVENITDEVKKVPYYHASVWDCFKGVYNKKDIEALERHLALKDKRDDFYEALSLYARVLQLALGSNEFYVLFDEDKINFYKAELSMFVKLKVSLQNRYAEVVSYKEYEPRIRKLIDTYVQADDVRVITEELNIFDKNEVNEAIEEYGKTPASKADFIAHQMKRVISENMQKDEAFYKKFSRMLEEVIEAFQEGRLQETEYLKSVLKVREQFEGGYVEDIPQQLLSKPEARAFYGLIIEELQKKYGEEVAIKKELIAKMGEEVAELIAALVIRDWKNNDDVINQMYNEVEDYLLEHRGDLGIEMGYDMIDIILEKSIKIAKNNY